MSQTISLATPTGEYGERVSPYVCPYCGEEALRPEPEQRWHCLSCLRLFSVRFHGVHTAAPYIPEATIESQE
jgi:ribosomal protein L37AE/L43A